MSSASGKALVFKPKAAKDLPQKQNGTRESEEPSSPCNWTKLEHWYFPDHWRIWQQGIAEWKKTTTALISHPSYSGQVYNKNIASELFNSLVQSVKNVCIWNDIGEEVVYVY
jgi:hypothetical protein